MTDLEEQQPLPADIETTTTRAAGASTTSGHHHHGKVRFIVLVAENYSYLM